MRVRCYLRAYRSALGLSLGQIAEATGLAKGELSMLERGQMLPPDSWIPRLQGVYGGAPEDWYPAGVVKVGQPDIRHCAGCEEELPPDANRLRRYHDGCRPHARVAAGSLSGRERG